MQIASLHLDTYRIVKHLEAKGYSEEQAEGFIEAVEQIDLVGVATRHDVKSSQAEMQQAISELRTETNELRKEIQGCKGDIQTLRTEMYRAMLYQTLATVGLTVTLLKFLN